MIYSYILSQYQKVLQQIQKYEFEFNFYNNLFLTNDCKDHHELCNCAFAHFKKAEEARAMLKILEGQKLELQTQYDLKKTSSNNNILTYGLTIGSAEKTDIQPCLYLWNKFINSADGKRCNNVEAFFEKGDSGHIHIHAIFTRTQKFSRSINELRKRFGIYKGKQHNFDPVRLKGLEIVKWKNYIRKDSKKTWNSSVNNSLKINDSQSE